MKWKKPFDGISPIRNEGHHQNERSGAEKEGLGGIFGSTKKCGRVEEAAVLAVGKESLPRSFRWIPVGVQKSIRWKEASSGEKHRRGYLL